jgi:DNA-binding PadR family transcriptional regulator
MHRHHHPTRPWPHEGQTGAEGAGYRCRRGGPFGPGSQPGGPFWGFGPGPRGRGRRRRGDVRVALLMLLVEGPNNGYGLMQTLEERSEGDWRPSPGSVYPALAQLEDEGFVRPVQSDSGRTFEITDAGRQHLEERGEQKPPWEADEDEVGGDARRAFGKAIASTAKAAAQVLHDGDEQQIASATELLTEVRRALYRLLAGDSEA